MGRQVLGGRARAVAFDVGVAAVVAAFAVLLVPEQHPLAVRLIGSALALLQVLVDLDGWAVPHDIAVLIAMYSVVKYADRVRDGLPSRAGGAAPGGDRR